MTEAEWLACDDPHGPMFLVLDGLVHDGRASGRKLRLLAVACCRRICPEPSDERSRTAVEVAERFADGDATPDELHAAYSAAGEAVDDCASVSLLAEDQAIAAYLTAATGVDEASALETEGNDDVLHSLGYAWNGDLAVAMRQQAQLLRDIFGNPFRPATFDPAWRTETAVVLARGMYESRDFAAMPILADALQDAGCTSDDILSHCRDEKQVHVPGCWVIDLVLGKA